MGVFEKAVASGGDILRYIPQRPPVVMVDTFYGIDGENSYSGYTVQRDGIFCRDGFLDECALIENMAQSAALRIGYICAAQGKVAPLGFIGAVGKCDIVRKVRQGERLHTTVKVIVEIGNAMMAEADITTAAGERICACTLKIVLRQ